jgi:cell wall-associated NlpC family hydrolase
MVDSPEPGKRKTIVDKAIETAKTAANTSYTYGGKTTSGFDCSGFVSYVFQQVFSDFVYLTADGIASSGLFKASSSPQPGDVIYFSKEQNPYEVAKKNTREYPAHVGIVVDAQSWIGRQSSQMGVVLLTNPWWSGRTHKYLSYTGFDASNSQSSYRSNNALDTIQRSPGM